MITHARTLVASSWHKHRAELRQHWYHDCAAGNVIPVRSMHVRFLWCDAMVTRPNLDQGIKAQAHKARKKQHDWINRSWPWTMSSPPQQKVKEEKEEEKDYTSLFSWPFASGLWKIIVLQKTCWCVAGVLDEWYRHLSINALTGVDKC